MHGYNLKIECLVFTLSTYEIIQGTIVEIMSEGEIKTFLFHLSERNFHFLIRRAHFPLDTKQNKNVVY